MSIGHGFSDPLWMSKRLIEQAHPVLLKKSVVEVIDHLEQVAASGTSPFEIIDRLVQVASVGKYTPQDPEETTTRRVFTIGEEGLTPEQEQEIADFASGMDRIPSSERIEGAESHADWLKRMGIPDINDFPQEDEDDEQE